INVPAWPWTTTSRRSWLGLPSSYRASTQQPLISSFHSGYDSKSATIAMIDSAGAVTSTVLLTSGIGRAYRLLHARLFQQLADGVRNRHRPARSAVDVHMHPVADGGDRLVGLLEDREPIRDAAVAQPRHRQSHDQWIGKLQLGQVLTTRLRDDTQPRDGQRIDPARGVDPSVDRGVEQRVVHGVVEVAEHVVVGPAGMHRPVHREVPAGERLLACHGSSVPVTAGWSP